MKLLQIFSLLLMGTVLASCGNSDAAATDTANVTASTVKAETPTSLVANRIEVIDFYGTHRCMTCKAIEKNTKYTLDTYFPDEVKEGKIVFKTVNVDEEENFGIAEAFQASGTALFLNVVKGKDSNKIDLTNNAFENGTDQAVFSDELKFFIENELKSL